MNKEQVLKKINYSEFYQEFIPSLKVNGKPEALGLCPFHDDTNPSLSVNLKTGLFRCFACDAKGDVFEFYKRFKDTDFPTALKEIAEMTGNNTEKPKTKVGTFEYKDEKGKTLYIKERLEPGRNGKPKEFVFKHQKGNQWILGRGCDPVLYRLPELIKSKYAFVVEGEGKADLLSKWGLVATSLDAGSNSPIKDEYIQILGSMEKVVILSDNDTPGKSYATKIANLFHGNVKELKVVELPGLKESEDVIDWAKIQGNNKDRLVEIIKNASVWTPKECEKHNSTMILTRLDSLFEEPEESATWLLDGILPTGGFSVVVAKPKVGKSTFARTLALHVASGKPFLSKDVSQGLVIYLALEDKRSEVKKHFRAMGAIGNEAIHIYTGGTPVDAIKQIRAAVESLKPSLLIIDPLFRLAKVKDGNDYIQVTNALDPLLRIARELKTHVLCVHHSSKGQRDGGDSVLGSTAIFGSVDTLMVMKRHENYRTVQTIQRYGDDLEETILNFDRETRTVTIGGTRQEQDVNMMKKAIFEFLSTQNEPITESVINQGVEGAVRFKCKALRELVAENKVNREGKGTKGNPFKYSTILLPSIYVEVEYENPKKTGNPHGCQGYSTSQDFDNFPKDEKLREVESLQKKEVGNEPENVSVEPINLDMLEVEL